MKTTDVIDHLYAGLAALKAQRPRVEAAAPFPQSDNILHEPEAYWYPPEVLAHLTEMLPYWLGEVERILAGGPEPVPYGRTAADSLRTGVIARDRTLPFRELYGRIEAVVGRATGRLRELSDADLDRPGLHPTKGIVTVGQIIDSSMAGHLEEHVRQIEELLTQPIRR